MTYKTEMAYEPAEDGIRVLRCYGKSDMIVIPAEVDGRPVTEIGPYAFSAGMDQELKPDQKPLCGDHIREIVLPGTLRKIGRYAFYNCDGLRKLSIAGTTTDIGAGAFNGCRKIQELTITITPGEKSCLKEILSELNETLLVRYLICERGEKREARLVFPTFYEEAVENTPARILVTQTHGCGHRYRYCFKGYDFQFREYDAVFPFAVAQESRQVATDLALARLRFPCELSGTAEKIYESYLEENMIWVGEYLIGKDDMDGIVWLITKYGSQNQDGVNPDFESRILHNNSDMEKVLEHASEGFWLNEGLAERAREGLCNIRKSALGEAELGKFIEAADRLGRVEILSFLMNEKYRLFKPERRKFKL